MTHPRGTIIQSGRTARELPTINLTPLIDILFIVLLFLVLTTAFEGSYALDVSLPAAQSADLVAVDQPDTIRVVVQADGRLFVRGRAVTLPELTRELDAAADTPRTNLVVAADASASHGAVVTVLDHARRVGITALRLETRRPAASVQP